MTLLIGDTGPDLEAETSAGRVLFHSSTARGDLQLASQTIRASRSAAPDVTGFYDSKASGPRSHGRRCRRPHRLHLSNNRWRKY